MPDLMQRFIDRFREADLHLYGSAVSYHLISALAPVVLCGLAIAGFLSLEEEWTRASFDLRPNVSPPAFEVIDSTVRRVLREKQGFWLSAGALLALWKLSAAMRAVMKGLSRVYGSDEDRPRLVRLRVSLGLAACVAVLGGGAILLWRIGPGGILRYPVMLALLLVLAGLVIRHAPATRQPWHWVSLGSFLSVGAWIVATALYTLYATKIADYGSAFGAFASIFVLAIYVYLTSMALLSGAVLDAVIREDD